MYLSWNIQHELRLNRSRSLSYAWALYCAEDIAIRRLVRKHTASHSRQAVNVSALTLFKA